MIIDVHAHLGDICFPGGGALIEKTGVRKRAGLDVISISEFFLHPWTQQVKFGGWLHRQDLRASMARNLTATRENFRRSMDAAGVSRSVALPVPPNVSFADLQAAAQKDPALIPFTGVDFTREYDVEAELAADVAAEPAVAQAVVVSEAAAAEAVVAEADLLEAPLTPAPIPVVAEPAAVEPVAVEPGAVTVEPGAVAVAVADEAWSMVAPESGPDGVGAALTTTGLIMSRPMLPLSGPPRTADGVPRRRWTVVSRPPATDSGRSTEPVDSAHLRHIAALRRGTTPGAWVPSADASRAERLSSPVPCVACSIPLSSGARFCRRCGTRQA